MNTKKALSAIEQHGILLVYPIDNRAEPKSLWSVLHPRSRMRWEWDDSGDDRVADLWHLREELSRSKKVVYAKWYRGRATFFSRSVFTALLATLGTARRPRASLGSEAQAILEILKQDSPLSTKDIKKLTDLRGRDLASVYDRALKELWESLWIVGFGEIDDGAFPSLAIGATQILFEDLWNESLRTSDEKVNQILIKALPEGSLFRKQLDRIQAKRGPVQAPFSLGA